MNTTRISMMATAALIALSGTALAQQAPQAPNMTFFITSIGPGKGADLGGLDGADAYCQRLGTAAGAGSKVWRAYLSTNAAAGSVNARDRIGRGPWVNFKGEQIAKDVDELHSDNNKLSQDTSLTERGQKVSGFGMTPNWHDVLTGSNIDGRAWPGNMNLTCGNWTSSTAVRDAWNDLLRHSGADTVFQKSWNSSHMSRACSQPDLIATGGNGLFYCFAAQ